MYGQESVINDSKQKETIILNVKLLTGIWESTDTLKSKIEFVDSKYYFFLQQEGEGHYTFMKDSLDRVSSSGFIAAWPPFNCDLKG